MYGCRSESGLYNRRLCSRLVVALIVALACASTVNGADSPEKLRLAALVEEGDIWSQEAAQPCPGEQASQAGRRQDRCLRTIAARAVECTDESVRSVQCRRRATARSRQELARSLSSSGAEGLRREAGVRRRGDGTDRASCGVRRATDRFGSTPRRSQRAHRATQRRQAQMGRTQTPAGRARRCQRTRHSAMDR